MGFPVIVRRLPWFVLREQKCPGSGSCLTNRYLKVHSCDTNYGFKADWEILQV